MNTAEHVREALVKVAAIQLDVQLRYTPNNRRASLVMRVYNDLMDCQDGGPESVEIILGKTLEYLAGGREFAAILGHRGPVLDLWDSLESALSPLATHVGHVVAYGESE